MEIVEHTKIHGINAAARQFKLTASTVSGWMKLNFDEQRSKGGRKFGAGRPLTYPPEFDEQIAKWILEQRELQVPVSTDNIKHYARNLISPLHPQFKASQSWLYPFFKRHNFSLRPRTSLSQKLPSDLEEKMSAFHNFVRRQRDSYEFEDNLIINMDETPVYFDIVPGKTVDQVGTKSVRVRTTGSEKRHITVVLSVAASGDVLAPMIIFKGKRELKLKSPKGWIIAVQQKAWMDEHLMLRWVKEIYRQYTEKKQSLCVLDSFRVHIRKQ